MDNETASSASGFLAETVSRLREEYNDEAISHYPDFVISLRGGGADSAPLKTMKRLLLFVLLCASGITAYAETVISAPTDTPISIRTESPEPKKGGGDFYTVKVSEVEGMTAEAGIPKTMLLFSREGTFSVDISVIHIEKGSCGGVESSVYSKQKFTIKTYKQK